MADVVEVVEENADTVEILTDEIIVVEVVETGPAGPQGIPGETPVSMAEFDGGNAFTVNSAPFPRLDLGSSS
jgi:hypothetical protein